MNNNAMFCSPKIREKVMRKCLMALGVAIAMWAGMAGAAGIPDVQEGLWERHGQTVSTPGNAKSESKLSICRDHASEKAAQAAARNIPGCPYIEPTVSGGKYYQEMRCVVAGTTIVTKGTIVFQGTSIHSETHTTFTPALGGLTEQTDVTDEKYLGSCPAGMSPGDTMNDSGAIRHHK
jgi:hypothetical protein